MLLRSSSTPVLGSLLASFSDSPSSQHLSELHGGSSSSTHRQVPNSSKISCGGSQNLSKKSLFHSSPSGAGMRGAGYRSGFRRAQSEGNLEELIDGDEFSLSKKIGSRPNYSSLEAIPSFSAAHLDENEEELELEDEYKQQLQKQPFVLKEEEGRMYLATGLGVSGMGLTDVGGGGGGGGSGSGRGSYRPVAFDRDSNQPMEEHYRRMLEGDPGNPMFLRNYAQFLYQEKGDPERAEEFYSRAILADPKDGEILSQYAKLIWEHHHDKNRAVNYFERAVQAATEDSHIHAAYASFLWDAEDDDEEEQENAPEKTIAVQSPFRQGFVASATA